MSEQHQASAPTQDVEQPTLLQFTAKYGEALSVSVDYDPKHKIWTQDKKEETEEEKQKAEKGNENFFAKMLQMFVAMNAPQAPQEEQVLQNENGEKFTLEDLVNQHNELLLKYETLKNLLENYKNLPTPKSQEND